MTVNQLLSTLCKFPVRCTNPEGTMLSDQSSCVSGFPQCSQNQISFGSDCLETTNHQNLLNKTNIYLHQQEAALVLVTFA